MTHAAAALGRFTLFSLAGNDFAKRRREKTKRSEEKSEHALPNGILNTERVSQL